MFELDQGSGWFGCGLRWGAALTALLVAPAAKAQTYGATVVAANFNSTDPAGPTAAELLISAPDDNWDAWSGGSITVYWRNGAAWSWDYLDQIRLGGALFTGATDGGTEADDRFGEVLAVGDFDGDGLKDLAIGVPKEDIADKVDAGCVHILYGAPSGPQGMPFRAATTYLTIASAFNFPVPASNDRFGASLAAGDFNRDGKSELVVGAPGRAVSGRAEAGVAYLFRSDGTTFSPAWTFTLCHGCSATPSGVAEAGDNYGTAVAVGNFNGDFDGNGKPLLDLAVSAPGQRVSGAPSAGNVTIYYTSSQSLPFNTQNNQIFTQAQALETPEIGDRFGSTLAVGNFNRAYSFGNAISCSLSDVGCWADDLAIGTPNEALGSNPDSGVVHVLYGASSGLVSPGQLFSAGSFSGASSQAFAKFGSALATGDVIQFANGGCQGQACNPMELVIGEPSRNLGALSSAGRVYTLQGVSNSVLTAAHTRAITDGTEHSGFYGSSLSVAQIRDVSGDPGPIRDVFIGEPGRNRAKILAGSVNTVGFPHQQETMAWPW